MASKVKKIKEMRFGGETTLAAIESFPKGDDELHIASVELMAHAVGESKRLGAPVAVLLFDGRIGDQPARARLWLEDDKNPLVEDDDCAGYIVTTKYMTFQSLLLVGHTIDATVMAYVDGDLGAVVVRGGGVRPTRIEPDAEDKNNFTLIPDPEVLGRLLGQLASLDTPPPEGAFLN